MRELTNTAQEAEICDTFREAFSTRAGKEVLRHLEKACHARTSTDISPKTAQFSPDGKQCAYVDGPIDPIKVFREDGMRAVYWLIVASIEKSEGALQAWELHSTEGNLNDGRNAR